ncbi:MAG: hypothetical protein JO152_16500, partial [Mycobacteriaceae bacterium]|nr:hypothetical protein [Mycobacteriaceae bacterium]
DIEGKVKAVRDAIGTNDTDTIQRAHDDLAASIQKIGESVYSQTQPGEPGTGDGSGQNGQAQEQEGAGAGGDDVVDAEFKEV